jgi:hypothetical protein
MSKSHPTRICTVCGIERRLQWKHRNRPDPYICKYCLPSQQVRPWIGQEEFQRDWNLRRRYGISSEEYETLLDAQDGVCAICKSPPKKNRLHVDHCHETGLVRGLLCAHCNSSLEWMLTWRREAEQYVRGLVSK